MNTHFHSINALGLKYLLEIENEIRYLGFDIAERTILHNTQPIACIAIRKGTITIQPLPEPIFIQTILEDQYGFKTYTQYENLKRINTKNQTISREYFTPDPDSDPKEIQSEIKRGQTFFNTKDGFLFGARVSLRNLGKFTKH